MCSGHLPTLQVQNSNSTLSQYVSTLTTHMHPFDAQQVGINIFSHCLSWWFSSNTLLCW